MYNLTLRIVNIWKTVGSIENHLTWLKLPSSLYSHPTGQKFVYVGDLTKFFQICN